jgi:hypothetical protein
VRDVPDPWQRGEPLPISVHDRSRLLTSVLLSNRAADQTVLPIPRWGKCEVKVYVAAVIMIQLRQSLPR